MRVAKKRVKPHVDHPFEARPYGPESSPDEIQAIKDRVYAHGPGVLYWRELPVQSVFQLDLFAARLSELSRDLPRYDLIIDLVEAAPPGAEIREKLKEIFSSQTKLRRAAVFTGKNFMLNIAAKFVLAGSVGLKNFSVHETLAQALAGLAHEARK